MEILPAIMLLPSLRLILAKPYLIVMVKKNTHTTTKNNRNKIICYRFTLFYKGDK